MKHKAIGGGVEFDDCAVVVMAKAPRAGYVKTRLAARIGKRKACALYKACLRFLGREWSFFPVTIKRFLAYDPELKADGLRTFFPPQEGWVYFPQSGRTLGERLERAALYAAKGGIKRVAVAGTDCLALSAQKVLASFHALKRKDAVLIPARDGGYVLLAWRGARPPQGIFQDIPWSTDRVAEHTLRKLKKQGLSFFVRPALQDLDEWGDVLSFLKKGEPRRAVSALEAAVEKVGLVRGSVADES